MENAVKRELYEETGLKIKYGLSLIGVFKKQDYEVYVYKFLVDDVNQVRLNEPDKHEEWFFTNKFYEYPLTPSMEFFKQRILESVIPYYIVFSGATCVGKSTIIKQIGEYIEDRGFEVCIVNESILKGDEYLLNLKEKNIEAFEYGLLNRYHNRRIELAKEINFKRFVIVDREVFDGDIYKQIYGFDGKVIMKERMPRLINTQMLQTEEIRQCYENNFLNIYPDAILIENNGKIRNTIVITGTIGAGKTQFAQSLLQNFEKEGKRVLLGKEVSLLIEEELNLYYEALNNNPKDESIVFWYQDKIIQEYQKYMNSITYWMYDIVILDRSYLDVNFFSTLAIKSDFEFIKENWCIGVKSDLSLVDN
ncbi:16127_t:CDS:2 [Dentiscutata heterogama]|uniref:16127_t:CDS:1 n=1 Tax=Dentiscutata heterogama TaxID=1316150 RepID=A0ACA9L2I9_9GLOM|nr:16127_t:CDS:2 [Dentiscutata heterogama]